MRIELVVGRIKFDENTDAFGANIKTGNTHYYNDDELEKMAFKRLKEKLGKNVDSKSFKIIERKRGDGMSETKIFEFFVFSNK